MNRVTAWASAVLVLLSISKTYGQQDECQDVIFAADTYCEEIVTWDDFVLVVDESVPGDQLYFCPFDIDKTDLPVVNITWGISIVCVLKDETDTCTFRGSGGFVNIATDDYTLFQSIHFRDTDDHAVHIESAIGDSSAITRTFCYCTFSGINRAIASRGGAFMTQENAGVVNLYYCKFLENYTLTRGAAVYTRTNQMNVVGSQFIDNTSVEWGAAIFVSQSSSLYVEGSVFIRNFGLNDYGVVVKPEEGSSVWTDGGNNLSSGDGCSGFYVLADDFCQQYTESNATFPNDDTPSPTMAGTPAPTSSPTSMADALCFLEEYDTPCLEVDTFAEIKEAIEANPLVIFCGGFEIEKPASEVISLPSNHDISCIETCTISGYGTHVEITGAQGKVRMSNFKYMLSDSSAVRVRTESAGATTTFCNSQFFRNTATLGGGIWIARQSGLVNVVGSTFTNNEAVKGGAIYGGAHMLLILESLFLNNVAFKAGSAVFTLSDSKVLFHSSYFAQNSVSSSNNYAVVVEDDSSKPTEGVLDGGGENLVVTSGNCDGFFVMASKTCKRFGKRERDSEENVFTTRSANATLAGNSTGNMPNGTIF